MLSWSYREEPHAPYWGVVNSHFNFCEEDYMVSAHIAEFINTLTNLTYILYASYGILGNKGKDNALLRNFPYFGLLAVGVGSTIFHSSMKNYTQWCDDLSMLVAVGSVIQRVYTYNKSASFTAGFALVLWGGLTAFSVWHCVTDELNMHSLLFGILTTISSFKTRAVINDRIKDPAINDKVKKFATRSTIIFAAGYAIWNADYIYCSRLNQTKRDIGMPWSFVLEFHGWWHILTGIGAYNGMALVDYLTSEEVGQPLEGRFAWPAEHIMNAFSSDADETAKSK